MLAQLSPEEQDTEMWIAANDRDAAEEQEGTWSNSDDTPFDYTHWAPGEPNGSDLVSDYRYRYFQGSSIKTSISLHHMKFSLFLIFLARRRLRLNVWVTLQSWKMERCRLW